MTQVKAHTFGHFAIVYAGSFYPPKRVISPIMAALKLLETDNSDVQDWYFHYYGPHEDHVRSEATRFGVSNRVVFHGNVPRSEVLSALRGAALAVVITSVLEDASCEDQSIVTGKLFESIGQGTPMLVIAPPNGDIHHVVETTGLTRTLVGTDIDGIASFLRGAMRGHVPKRKFPEAYSLTNIVTKLDAVLRDITTTQNAG
jgi:glycosyltransferase involved in cell wall biosynthesis